MKFYYIIVLLIILLISYINTYIIYSFLSEYYKCLYTSFITLLLIIVIIDGNSILNELNYIKNENQELHKLLNIHIIESKKMHEIINIFKIKK